MRIDAKMFDSPCGCGHKHTVTTRHAIIEHGCMKSFDTFLTEPSHAGRRAAIYDSNTYAAQGLVHPSVSQEVVLPADGLRTDSATITQVLGQLTGNTQLLVAIGGGTIHDIVRICAHKLGIPFVSCPTAASCDGFASSFSVMQDDDGMARLVPCNAPVLVLADLDIIENAPVALMRAGVGNAISNFTTLADQRIASLLGDRLACPTAESLLRQAAITAQGACDGLMGKMQGAYAQLMYALLLSGIATQLNDAKQPVHAAGHHLNALMAMMPEVYRTSTPLTHGEMAGMCTTAIADVYHQLTAIDDISTQLKPFAQTDAAILSKYYDAPTATLLAAENTPDCLQRLTPEKLASNWNEIRHIVAEIPTKEALSAILASVGATATTEDAGISASKLHTMLQAAPYLENQLTLLRIMRIIKFRYASSASASRAPSRKSRYTDKAIKRAGSKSAVSASSMR